ncbi:phosphatidylserine decarboxylase 1 [Bachmanniomyces sp. S44760]|nr:phosphatidylserine decarboxylase 1 [Bachmanniomyces sp. S44760]
MASISYGRTALARRSDLIVTEWMRRPCLSCRQNEATLRRFTTFTRLQKSDQPYGKEPFIARLRLALGKTRVKWYPIPVGLGVAFLGFTQLYRLQQQEKRRREDEEEEGRPLDKEISGEGGKPKKRKRIRPGGPWQVQVMSTLPLKAVSRLWGKFNELEIPYYLRVPGFKLYSWVFGVNLSEVSEPDLHIYPNLASFFYRTLKPGVRPLDPNTSTLLSPADGKVLQFGTIERGEVEQVKGMTYSVDALLGSNTPSTDSQRSPPRPQTNQSEHEEDTVRADQEFANMNGVSYTLPNLFSGPQNQQESQFATSSDASTESKSSSEAEVRADLALGSGGGSWLFSPAKKVETSLYYIVVYLAPGDYHRFHSPTSWVAERRRHFAGELYSVSPYLQRTLPGLFTLNERVVLLGRWRWGFFSYTPVGATNVGSIKINFDSELRTNSLTTDTAADRAAEDAAKRGEPYSGYSEATYSQASKVLGGHALRRGEEMGGFQLGSSIVLVFEAPSGRRKSFDEGWEGGTRKGGWRWRVEKGQKVKYGESIGWVDENWD